MARCCHSIWIRGEREIKRQTQKRLTIAVKILAAVVLIAVLGGAVAFFLMTDSYEKATNVCLQISAQDGRGALQICRVGTGNDSMPGLDFFVTTHGDPDAPQELFIYRRWPIDRLSKVMDTV